MQLGGTINDKKKTGRPTSWTPDRKNQLKRLVNNRKGVKNVLVRCLKCDNMNISCYKSVKTPKHSENGQTKKTIFA